MLNKIKLTDTRFWADTRFWVFTLLIVLAPLSKYPSIALPAFNFSSFRLGIYQVLLVLFILLCAKPILTSFKMFWEQNKLATFSLLTLLIVSLVGLFWDINFSRSALLVGSICLLIAGVFCAWWFAANQLNKQGFRKVIDLVLWAAIVYGALAILQFLVSTFTSQSLGILCTNCTSAVFGFPRVNGLSAEPQFFANALLPFLFISLGVFYKNKSKLSFYALIFSTLAIGLTFSRGAYAALFCGLVIFALLILFTKQAIKPLLYSLLVIALAGFTALVLLVGSASYKYNQTPNITYNTIKSTLQHLSLGVINLPEKTVVVVNIPTPVANDEIFVSPGLIEASTNERLSAAELAIKAWQNSFKTVLIGTGAGNLGPFVVANINSGAPNNLTVYIYYVLVLAELGILGLIAFVGLLLSAVFALFKNRSKNSVVFISLFSIIFAFALQYLFFGSYINVIYIWVWLGIAVGYSVSQIAKNKL